MQIPAWCDRQAWICGYEGEKMTTQHELRATTRKLAIEALDRGDYELSAKLLGGSGKDTTVAIELPDDVMAEIKQQYVTEELNQSDISDMYGINRAKICLYFKQQGWTAERRKAQAIRVNKITTEVAKLLRQGLKQKEIVAMGYTIDNVRVARQRYGLHGMRGKKPNESKN